MLFILLIDMHDRMYVKDLFMNFMIDMPDLYICLLGLICVACYMFFLESMIFIVGLLSKCQ